jgi:predicted nucleic acid-binding protein
VATAYFLDSSASVKRYVVETGTTWVRSITRRKPGTHLYIALITAVEVTSAVARRRGLSLPSARASLILSRFRKHLAGRYLASEITPALVNDAMKLANTHRLRAYDAMQLASAVDLYKDWSANRLGAFVFVSADRNLNAAATAEGLTVDDPNFHPQPSSARSLTQEVSQSAPSQYHAVHSISRFTYRGWKSLSRRRSAKSWA